MNSSTFRFSLDLHSAQSQISIPVLLGDTGRTFRISLSDGGAPYIIADGCIARLSVKRPSGTQFTEYCTIENNNTIVYQFEQNPNTAAVVGIHDCDITLFGADGKEVASPRFSMIVNERVINKDDLVLTDEDKYNIDAIDRAEASRQAAEVERVNAEAARVEAETARVEAETARATAMSKALADVNNVILNVKDGKSAYANAVENGYQGTEEEFGKALASIANVTIYSGEVGDIV